ncbi:hypothetical protein LGM43_11015 [Burkholderia seminalis]|uniref:hypothetical protein n=1 Tax=Burkholderia seminalis TaxID=488731 RepID=UPI001907ADBF|nr:hypothetical protein [Burkholderia seminalis]MBJ9965408.1 hypothetical protein [Burkholderia seminalis]MCA7950807.1 hypothetical protein [Burkholderia seminalis]
MQVDREVRPRGQDVESAAMVSLSPWCVAGLPCARVLRTERQWHCPDAGPGLPVVMPSVPMGLP